MNSFSSANQRRASIAASAVNLYSLIVSLTLGASCPILATPPNDDPLYARLLVQLQTGQSVRPPALPVHPVDTVYNREAIVPPQ